MQCNSKNHGGGNRRAPNEQARCDTSRHISRYTYTDEPMISSPELRGQKHTSTSTKRSFFYLGAPLQLGLRLAPVLLHPRFTFGPLPSAATGPTRLGSLCKNNYALENIWCCKIKSLSTTVQGFQWASNCWVGEPRNFSTSARAASWSTRASDF